MISPDTIARVKERTDIVAFIGETVRLVRRGRSFIGLCPFHKEKSPSFHVHLERGFYHCFGCGESGSAIDFAMKTHGLDFIEALKLLAEKSGVPIEETQGGGERSREKKTEREEVFAVLALAATYFEGLLSLGAPGSAHPTAHHGLTEIQRRGLPEDTTSPEARRWLDTLQAFRVGYAPPGWNGLADFLAQQGASPTIAERAGLLVPGQRGHYDRFRHRLMFAVADNLGRVVAFSGRALAPPTQDELAGLAGAPSYGDKEVAKYVNSPETPVFTKGEHLFGIHQAKQGIRSRGEALLVEGNFDVVSLHARGIDHAVAPLGTAFTTDQAKLLKRFAQQVIVLFDGDAAGRKATRAARVPCREGGLEAKVASLPKGRDPDDYVREKGAEALLAVVKDATGMLEHLIHEALDGTGFGDASIAERVARVRAVAKLLGEEQDPAVRLMAKRFADQLSSKLVLAGDPAQDLSGLERMVEQAVRGQDAPREQSPRRPPPPQDTMALRVFGAILDYPDLIDDPDVMDALGGLEGDLALSILSVRRHLLGAEGPHQVADFLAALPSSIQSFAAGRLASPVFEDIPQAKTDLLDNSNKIRSLLWRRQASDAQDVLMRSPSALDVEGESILRELERRARKKRGLDE